MGSIVFSNWRFIVSYFIFLDIHFEKGMTWPGHDADSQQLTLRPDGQNEMVSDKDGGFGRSRPCADIHVTRIEANDALWLDDIVSRGMSRGIGETFYRTRIARWFEPTWPEQALLTEMAVASYKKANLKEFLHSFLPFRKNFEKKGAIFFGSMCSSWVHLPRTNRGQKK